jgi:hypothetical protein
MVCPYSRRRPVSSKKHETITDAGVGGEAAYEWSQRSLARLGGANAAQELPPGEGPRLRRRVSSPMCPRELLAIPLPDGAPARCLDNAHSPHDPKPLQISSCGAMCTNGLPGTTAVRDADGWMSRLSRASSLPIGAYIHLPVWHHTCSNLPKLNTVVPAIGGHCFTRFQYPIADFQ